MDLNKRLPVIISMVALLTSVCLLISLWMQPNVMVKVRPDFVSTIETVKVEMDGDLPKGYKVVRSSATGEYKWVDGDGRVSTFPEDSYEDAVESAVSMVKYLLEEKLREEAVWETVGESKNK